MFKRLSNNLNMLMAKARLNSSELARLTGLPATTIKRIRNNEQSNPTVATLIPIAQYFSMTISELLDCEIVQSSEQENISRGLKLIPLLSWQECVNVDELDYLNIRQKKITEKSLSPKGFCVLVEDKELDFFPEQSLLIVEPALHPISGDYIIIKKSGHNVASIKKYIVEADQTYLKSLVKGLGIIPFTDEYRILGIIVQYRVDLHQKK